MLCVELAFFFGPSRRSSSSSVSKRDSVAEGGLRAVWVSFPQCFAHSISSESSRFGLLRSSPAAMPSLRNASYQIPLSLPVSFCPITAAVASHGNRLSRAPHCSSLLPSASASCAPYSRAECGKIGTRKKPRSK